MVLTQEDKFKRFSDLHRPGKPVILFNVWDAGSAQAVYKAGAAALATGSYSVAHANGFGDGENTPLDLVLSNAKRISEAVDVPVSIDFECGYGETPDAAAASFSQLLNTGIVGVNIEDNLENGEQLRSISEQTARLEALSAVRTKTGARGWLNARTDVFLQSEPNNHAGAMANALERAAAYASAGADSLFVPGLVDPDLIASVCAASPLPVNVMLRSADQISLCAEAGVARISFGSAPWLSAMKHVLTDAETAFQQISMLADAENPN